MIGFALLFADSRERRTSQIALVLAVATSVTASLLIVNFLDRPYGAHEGSIKPTAMRSALTSMQRDLLPGGRVTVPQCDEDGAFERL